MNSIKIILVIAIYVVLTFAALFGLIWGIQKFGASDSTTTLIAALGGALAASLGPIITAMLTSSGQTRETDEKIRDEASRVSLELTRMDYELRQQALPEGYAQQFLAPAKVYREFYKAIVELRVKGTWPKSIEELGLLSIFTVARKQSNQADSNDKTIS
ncbi:hypothetical protein C4565_09940 [Candidatus Parcubacteria bacterium]|nr:MAG: hypothetical protein C4565_09940 [Candidatus Parcubacteria bacterium]